VIDSAGTTVTAPLPRVSVVVPTRNRPYRLERLLAGLRAQTVPAEQYEVIIVADGVDEPTRGVLAAEQAGGALQLRVVTHATPRGPAAARNAGWLLARAPLVAFTDDDCVPAPGWLAAALDASPANAVLQGRTKPDASELGVEGVLSRTVSVDRLGPQYETCNIFYPRALLEVLGGFDERFGLAPGGEDTDLAWRAIEAGWPTVLVPGALVFHAVERLGVRGTLRVAARWSATMRVFAEHPQTRSMLYRRIFWNVWHYLLWRSLLALLGPAWLRRLLVSRHLVKLRGRAQLAGSGSWAIPFLIVHDAVECWAVLRGSVRCRTLVL
jgi:glycosyltransferase involved in cell wall biosynthesis